MDWRRKFRWQLRGEYFGLHEWKLQFRGLIVVEVAVASSVANKKKFIQEDRRLDFNLR